MIYALQEIKVQVWYSSQILMSLNLNSFYQIIEDHHLLLGHLCLLMGMYDQAQEHFLSSSNPVMALEVCMLSTILSVNLLILYRCAVIF